jgi:chemosensory pili system protein ChpA (sensor histidine kinase/response regulator)
VSHQVRRSHQPRILIVDSSANVRRYLAMTLTKSGFLTEQVQDGKEAIAFLKDCLGMRLNVDVVITDLEMPHMDGFKLLSNIRADADFQHLPIIVLTTKNNENDQKLALDLGANAYFSKPYREQELVKKLHQLMAG